jgi:hypothetical protein
MSTSNFFHKLPFNIATLISENYPLRGKEAGDSMRDHLAKMSNQAANDGLKEEEISRILSEE